MGRAEHLGVEHIPAYSPEARGRSEPCWNPAGPAGEGTGARRHHRHRGGQPLHPPRLPAPAQCPLRPACGGAGERLRAGRSGAARRDPVPRGDARGGARQHRRLWRAAASTAWRQARAHFVKATVKVRHYPDRTLAVFHGPRRLACYAADGRPIAAPAAPRLASGAPPSRRGLAAPVQAAGAPPRPASTAAHEAPQHRGRSNGLSGRTKKPSGRPHRRR